ncbi:hypothetical protein [Caldiplasma sukawensis]
MGIFAILIPLMSLYIIIRLFARSVYSWIFLPVNGILVFSIYYVYGNIVSVNLTGGALAILIFLVFVFSPLLMIVMRYRRKHEFSTGSWKVSKAFYNNAIPYVSSFIYYIFSIVFIISETSILNSFVQNYMFYVFIIFSSIYYMVLVAAIVKHGKIMGSNLKNEKNSSE